MIPRLASPSVCVIDDEPQDYEPILNALLRLGIGCVHIKGDDSSPLPPAPFKGLRVVFVDLHLTAASIGKTTASHTANVVLKVISPESAPILMVIWSKHSDEKVEDAELPPDDQPTQADLFVQTLNEAEPRFRDRLIITKMPKPKVGDRSANPEQWVASVQSDIEAALKEFPACDLLWSWEALVRDAEISIAEEITNVALKGSASEEHQGLDEQLKLVFRVLAKEQGGPDCSRSTVARHLTTVLAQLLGDHLEHLDSVESLNPHADWLCDHAGLPKSIPFAAQLNGTLLTAAVSSHSRAFVPGTVYFISDVEKFEQLFGLPDQEFLTSFFQAKKSAIENWEKKIARVAVEISPACDFHQDTRRQALVIAGLVVHAEGRSSVKRADGIEILPTFSLRWKDENSVSDVFLTVCSRYKLSLPHGVEPDWLVPWFRLRELPTASLRNWHASHASRVGYISLR